MIKKKTILFIDDEELNLLSLIKTFKYQYDVFTALNLASAKEIIIKENIDLILCDIVFPEGNSIAFLRELEKDKPELKIIIISGYLEEFKNDINELKNCLFLIQKPKTPKYYKKIVKEILRGLK